MNNESHTSRNISSRCIQDASSTCLGLRTRCKWEWPSILLCKAGYSSSCRGHSWEWEHLWVLHVVALSTCIGGRSVSWLPKLEVWIKGTGSSHHASSCSSIEWVLGSSVDVVVVLINRRMRNICKSHVMMYIRNSVMYRLHYTQTMLTCSAHLIS
jgi:hypothetical protein